MAKKQQTYNQCKLTRKEGDVTQVDVSYIPSKFAKVGSVLKIKQEDGSWIDGWVVESVGAEADAERINAMYNMWQKWRGVTDVPKGTFKDKNLIAEDR